MATEDVQESYGPNCDSEGLTQVALNKSNAPTILDELRRALKQERTTAERDAIRASLNRQR